MFTKIQNIDARRHVNAMCLAADVPLVESGTQGYLGQAYVIKKVGRVENMHESIANG